MKSTKFKLVRDFLALSCGHCLSKLVTFVAFAYLARTLQPEYYGFVEFAVALSLFFTMIVDLGLGAVGARELAKAPSRQSFLTATIPVARLLMAIAVVPIMGLSAWLLNHSAETVLLVWLFAIALFALPWKQDWLLQGLEMMKAVAAGQVIRTAGFTIGVFVFVHGPRDLTQVGMVEILAATAAALFYIVFQHVRIAPVRLRFSIPALQNLLRQGSSVGLSHIVWAMNQYIQLILLASIVGGEETAWFGGAHRIVASILEFSNVYHFNLFPALVRKIGDSPDSFNELIRSSFRVVAWCGILVALLFTLFARPILVTAFGERFGAAAPALAILIWAFPITALSGHARWSLIAMDQQKCVLFAQIAGAAVTLLASPLLILQYKAVGAAIGIVSANLVVWFTAHAFAALRVGHMPFLQSLTRPAALAICIALLCLTFGSSPWFMKTILAVGVMCAPLIDPKLIPDLRRLALAKSDLDQQFPATT